MKIGIYPGSFNPWHEGHADILKKAAPLFDNIVIAVGHNPEKNDKSFHENLGFMRSQIENLKLPIHTTVTSFSGLLADFVKEQKGTAIIRGLRNGHDLQYEMNQQYWNEDLGLEVPTIYFICDRNLSHISSSALRMLQKIRR